MPTANSSSNAKDNARITGVLFILGTTTGIAAAVLSGPLFLGTDYLSAVAGHRVQVLLAALLVMCMGFACAGIGISLYPVLKRHSEGLAAGAMGFRIIEGTLQIISAIGLVTILAIAQEFGKAGSPANSWYQPAGAITKIVYDWVNNGAYLFPWCIAATIYYLIFYKTRLVPRWLSVWGLAGLALMAVSAFGLMFGWLVTMSPIQGLLNLPIALQEMVLAVWLIVKGYKK